MSASGVKLFDDDLAADVRDLFRELLQRGETGSEATPKLIQAFHSVIGTVAVSELLDWVGPDVTKPGVVTLRPSRRNKRYASESAFYFPMTKKHLSRCRSLNLQLEPTMRDDGGYLLPLNFDELPTELAEYFG